MQRKEFNHKVNRMITPSLIKELNMTEWKLCQAPAQSDLVWDKLNKRSMTSSIKSWTLSILLFVISVLVLSPLTRTENLSFLVSLVNKITGSSEFGHFFVTNYISPLILFFVNFICIPFLIYYIALAEDNRKKSKR